MKKNTLTAILACAMTAAALMGCSPAKPEAAVVSAAAETTVEKTTAAETTAAEVSTEAPGTGGGVTLRVGSLKGPTSMGLVSLMDQASRGEAKGNYEFTMVTAADELQTKEKTKPSSNCIFK